MFSNSNSPYSNYPKSEKNQTLIFAPFTVNFGLFCISGTRISVMDHEIIKTKLKFEFPIVKLPKKLKKSNFKFCSF
jgi:hypothetical protein